MCVLLMQGKRPVLGGTALGPSHSLLPVAPAAEPASPATLQRRQQLAAPAAVPASTSSPSSSAPATGGDRALRAGPSARLNPAAVNVQRSLAGLQGYKSNQSTRRLAGLGGRAPVSGGPADRASDAPLTATVSESGGGGCVHARLSPLRARCRDVSV